MFPKKLFLPIGKRFENCSYLFYLSQACPRLSAIKERRIRKLWETSSNKTSTHFYWIVSESLSFSISSCCAWQHSCCSGWRTPQPATRHCHLSLSYLQSPWPSLSSHLFSFFSSNFALSLPPTGKLLYPSHPPTIYH